VPTARPRHTITETEEVSLALDEAGRRWPEERKRSGLVRRLLEAGHRAIRADREREAGRRREAGKRTSGALTGVYGRDYLEQLRDDWPR
jgi:hypothetical protein